MPDRSSGQGLPDGWSQGSHAARGPYPGAGPADTYGAGMAGAPGSRAADAHGIAATAAYRTGNADSFRTRPADPFGDADSFRTRPADPFGDADSFGVRGLFGPVPADGPGAAATAEAGSARADGESLTVATGDSAPGAAADAKGFLGALFDFGFTSFVTPKVIKVLYMLIMIGTVVSALVFTIIMFRVSTPFGILTLLVADPLFILIVMAIYRVILEFFVVVFRVAEDLRALRERDEHGL
jgi:Domain of unknown function (DUF4282)